MRNTRNLHVYRGGTIKFVNYQGRKIIRIQLHFTLCATHETYMFIVKGLIKFVNSQGRKVIRIFSIKYIFHDGVCYKITRRIKKTRIIKKRRIISICNYTRLEQN